MAYNRRYGGNPDALPAHVEPEQAAAMLSNKPTRGSSRDDVYITRAPASQSAPPPRGAPQDDRYRSNAFAPPRRTNSSTYDTYNDRAPPSNSRNDSYGRADDRGAKQSGYGGRYEDRGYDDRQRSGGHGGQRDGGRPPPTPSLVSDREALRPMFRAVDKAGAGALSERELGAALVNGDYTQFDPHTVKMMIRMFDVDRSGTIDFDEFCGLWGFLSEWRKLFNRFDVDHSGQIDYKEFSSALVAFGYKLSPEYVSLLFDTYDTRGRGVLSFDLFVQSCISLKRMTDVFKRYDQDRDGYITLSFEQFLTGSQSLFLLNSISPDTDRGVY